MMSNFTPQSGIGQMANPVRIVLRAIAVVVNEMSPRKGAAALLDYCSIQIYAPVVIVVNVVACTHQKGADIAAEIQDLTTLPNRAFKHLVEVGELRYSGRDKIPRERPTLRKERSRNRQQTALRRQVTSIRPVQTSTVHGTGSGRTP